MKKSTTAGLALAALAGTTLMMFAGAASASAAPGGGGALRPLVSAGTITQTQARTVHEQLKAACEEARAEAAEYGTKPTGVRTAALAKLVSDGTITQAQSDAIAAALPAPGSKHKTGERTHAGARGTAAPTTAPAA